MKRTKLLLIITACSLLAGFLLCAVAYNIAIRVPVPVEYKDFEDIDVDFDEKTFSFAVSSKAGGLYCSTFTTDIDDEGVLYLTIKGVPLNTGEESYCASFDIPDGVKKIVYKYKYDNTTLRVIEFNTEE